MKFIACGKLDLDHTPEDSMALLSEFGDKIAGFGLGLDISYPKVSLLNDGNNAYHGPQIEPGHRGVDAFLAKPGMRRQTVRLQEVTKNNRKFKVVVFAGKPNLTRSALQSLRQQVDKHKHRYAHAVEYVKIIEGLGVAFDEALGVRKFGNAYWDIDSSAHWAYGVLEVEGAVVVLRPDGIVGTLASLSGFEEIVVPYLNPLIVARDVANPVALNGHGDVGELLNPFENNLGYSRKNAQMA